MTALNELKLPKKEPGDRTQESGLLHPAAGISEKSWQIIIFAISAAVILFSVYCLSNGITIIFMHLYYLPIVLLAYRYRYRGFVLSVIISLIYICLVLFFSWGQNEVIIGAFIRFLAFIGIAAVVAYLSEQFRQSEKSLKKVADIQQSSLMNANVWLMLLDPRGSVLLWNNAAERISGYSASEVTGSDKIWKLLYPDKDYRAVITKKIERILLEDSFFENLETKIRTRSGEERFISWNTRSFPVTSEQEASSVAIGIDITERKRAEEALRINAEDLHAAYEELTASEEELRQNLDALTENERILRLSEERLIMSQEIGHTGCWEYDLVSDKIWSSAEGRHLFGFPPVAGAFPIVDIEACIPERERVHAALIDLINAGKEYNLEYTINPRDGSAPKVIFSIARLEKDAQGNPLRIIGIIRDITDRKVAEDALRIKDTVFESSIAANSIGNNQGIITSVNPAFLQIWGYRTKDDAIGKSIASFFANEKDAVPVLEALDTFGRWEGEFTARRADGSTFIAFGIATVIRDETGKQIGYQSTLIDITERKRADEFVRVLARMSDNAPASITVHDFDGNFVYANEETLRLHGYTREEYLKTNLHEIDVPESKQLIAERMQKIRDMGEAEFDVQHFRKDGSKIPLHVNVKIIDWGNRKVLLSIATDLTERKVAEEALHVFKDLVEHSSDAIGMSTPEGKHYYQNEAFDRMFGEIGDNPPDTVYVDKAIGKQVFDTITGGGSWQGELKMFRADRTILEIFVRAYAIKNLNGRVIGLVGLHNDITERKRAEDALRRVNQKLNVLSMLTRKDLDNQIFILSSYLELAKHQLAGQDNIIKTIQKGARAIQSIHETIEYSKDYQDMGSKPQKWQNVNMAMLFGLSHISIGKIQHSLETENLEIFADPLLEKVCQRLFENSVKHGDHVTRIRVWHTMTPDGVAIFFEDDGIGIAAEKKKQIFLREEGPNASMRSLIFVREILDITGITIRETGEPGKGARFEIAVPKGAYRFTGKP
ncbi:MAG: PAS domain S-box protein [Methanoregula sp.]|nr:PAS domain S-box protein [Methanoregula sp.]